MSFKMGKEIKYVRTIMNDSAIYALKVQNEWRSRIYKSLINGEGRFGWSYIQNADLRVLKLKITTNGLRSLSKEEKDCYQRFLLDIKVYDYVVYINVPEWGKCTIARVTGDYLWRYEDDDFNHRFPVDPDSVFTFDRNDAVVHPSLSARLKLQGRFWRIYLKKEFESLLLNLKQGLDGKQRTSQNNHDHLTKEIQPLLKKITEKIHHTHPNTDLESLIAAIFRKIPGVKEVQLNGGPGDHGADLIVDYESGLPVVGLNQQVKCVVQIKSFQGEHCDLQAVDDIRRAFEHYPDADIGLIISTANSSTDALDSALDDIRNDKSIGKPVSLLIGADLATFYLRFSGELAN